jgi:hypothetical protein
MTVGYIVTWRHLPCSIAMAAVHSPLRPVAVQPGDMDAKDMAGGASMPHFSAGRRASSVTGRTITDSEKWMLFRPAVNRIRSWPQKGESPKQADR